MFKNPFSFDGRIRRMDYGITFIIYLVLYVKILGLSDAGGAAGGLLTLIILIPMMWFVWAQGAKRCHDLDKSGWWQIIPFYFFVLLFQDGEPGINDYGHNPKGIPGPDGREFSDSETLDGHLRSN